LNSINKKNMLKGHTSNFLQTFLSIIYDEGAGHVFLRGFGVNFFISKSDILDRPFILDEGLRLTNLAFFESKLAFATHC